MITVNDTKCNGCGKCVKVCPSMVFLQPEKGKVPDPARTDFCISCFHCVDICPKEAVTHIECSPENLEKFHNNPLAPEAVKELFLSRRSIRNYKDMGIPDDVIEELLDLASSSETGSNLQAEGFIVIRNRNKLDSLELMMADILWNKGFKFMKEKGPITALLKKKYSPELWASFRRYNQQFAYKKEHGGLKGTLFWNAPALIIVHGMADNTMAPQNAAIAVRDIEILAHSMGLGSCWSGFIVAAADLSGKINKFLGLDKTRKVLGALMLGYPVYSYKHRIPRKKRNIKYM